jgi:hypothetical protein
MLLLLMIMAAPAAPECISILLIEPELTRLLGLIQEIKRQSTSQAAG